VPPKLWKITIDHLYYLYSSALFNDPPGIYNENQWNRKSPETSSLLAILYKRNEKKNFALQDKYQTLVIINSLFTDAKTSI